MPGKSSATCACRIDDRKTKPCSQPAIARGIGITRGSTRGACTIAMLDLRPNASLPSSSITKLRLLLSSFGNGCAGSSPSGVSTGISSRKEIFFDPFLLRRVPLAAAQEADALGRELRKNFFVEHLVLARDEFLRFRGDLAKHFAQRYAVGTGGRVGGDFFLKARYPDLEEFVEIAVDDAQKTQALERGHRAVFGQGEHAAVEFELSEFAIEVKLGRDVLLGHWWNLIFRVEVAAQPKSPRALDRLNEATDRTERFPCRQLSQTGDPALQIRCRGRKAARHWRSTR